MTDAAKNHNFDWVTVRHECSLGLMFIRLRQGAETDVATRDRIEETGKKQYRFRLENQGRTFVVYREGPSFKAIEFSIDDKEIAALSTHDKSVDLRATLTLNDDGDCKLLVNADELYEWQFRKRALERLFFDK